MRKQLKTALMASMLGIAVAFGGSANAVQASQMTISAAKKAATVTIASGNRSYKVDVGAKTLTLKGIKKTGDGKLTYKVTKGSSIVKVDSKGVVTLLKTGSATISVKTTETKKYKASAAKTVSITVDNSITSAYKTFVKQQNAKGYMNGKYKIVDVDKNGTPELLFYNTNTMCDEVYTYNRSTKKKVKLISFGYGKWGTDGSAIAYNTSKSMVRVSHADTGGTLIKFYKISGQKKTQMGSFEYRNVKWDPKRKSKTYLVDNKKVSEKTYNSKYNSMNKGYTNLK